MCESKVFTVGIQDVQPWLWKHSFNKTVKTFWTHTSILVLLANYITKPGDVKHGRSLKQEMVRLIVPFLAST